MCASYGLDPRFTDSELLEGEHTELLERLRRWATDNGGEPVRPTGKNLRNLNPLLTHHDGAAAVEEAWWGYLVDGAPAKFPSINTRFERLRQRPAPLRSRAIVPTTGWFEMRKPSRIWHEFGVGGTLFGMAAVTQPGRTADGASFTCYSIITRSAPAHLRELHDRVPLLVPAAFAHEWLAAPDASPALLDDVMLASDELVARVSAAPRR